MDSSRNLQAPMDIYWARCTQTDRERERAAAAGILCTRLVLSLRWLRIEDVLRPVGALWASKVEPPIFVHLREYLGCKVVDELNFFPQMSKKWDMRIEVEFLFFM